MSWLVVLLGLVLPSIVLAETWGKLELQNSLRGPYQDSIPDWKKTGAVSVQQNSIKLLPQSHKQSAFLWNDKPVSMKSWEVILEFGVRGPAPLSTGEGLAFWHVSDPGSSGAVYGHSDRFAGLGIFFDSYDADNNGEGEPYVLAMYNDGTKPIDAEGAGLQLGVCFANYRNLPFPARAKIAYNAQDKGHLTVGLDIENTGKFKSCISVHDVVLRPQDEYFGLTVSDYANDYEIFSLLAINLDHVASTEQQAKSNEGGEAIQVIDDEAGKDGLPLFESHTGFMKIKSKMTSLSDRLAGLHDQFSRQFHAVFNNHNKGLEFHVNKVQGDVREKHTDLSNRVDVLARHLDTVSRSIDGMKGEIVNIGVSVRDSGRALTPQAAETVDRLSKMRVSCVQENHRGDAIVTQLQNMVNTLQKRQETLKIEVHDTLAEMDTTFIECGGSGSIKALAVTLVGVVVGMLVGSAMQTHKREHLL